MSIFLTIIAIIVIFSVIVLIHEYGHFSAAKRAGIKVLEFGIGFPPRLYGKKIGETIYSINAIPIGGFVKLYGEDSISPAVIKNKRSFASKSPWTRTKVIAAGVVMNLILAIFLLTVGFSFGIEPLLVTEKDLFYHLEKGNVISSPGIFVSKVKDEAQAAGVQEGDQILAIDDKPITQLEHVTVLQKGQAVKDIDATILSEDGAIKKIHVPLVSKNKFFGITLKPVTDFPRLYVSEVKKGSPSQKAGLLAGDVILQINGKDIYFAGDFESTLTFANEVDFNILRNDKKISLHVIPLDRNRTVIADVFEQSAAQKAGFNKGDIIVAINGAEIKNPQAVQDIIKENVGTPMQYEILRAGRKMKIIAQTEKGKLLGIILSQIESFKNTDISFYQGTVVTSITEIKKVRYPPWRAFKQSISESVRLMGVTAQAFTKALVSMFSRSADMSEIGGPVQIAYYTHTFIQEGFFALLRFTALLSLSLAVINILPIPALDGGRLLFIGIEVLFKKRVSARLESMVHGIGFLILILFIVLITYSDILKLF